MKRLADQIKQALSALARADEGEVSGRYRMEAALNPAPASPRPASSPHRLVALGVGRTLPTEVMDYVIGVCRRMQANLLLLSTDPEGLRHLLAPHLPALQGISCEAEPLDGASRRTVMAVLARRSGVLFAVSGTTDDPVRCLVDGKRGLLSRDTPVPVVVVGAAAARTDLRADPRTRKPVRKKLDATPAPADLGPHSLLQP